MRQADVVLKSEGDAWFLRNFDHLGFNDPVTRLVDEMDIQPTTMLEVGCANGWRLARWTARYGARCLGIEPGPEAVLSGNSAGRSIRRGTADRLPTLSDWANVLIYGFCLYLTDPEDWLRIAAEGDRVLMSGGYLIIHDFMATSALETRDYAHDERLLAYHYDFSLLWLAHPRYSLIRRLIDDSGETMVSILRKNGVRAGAT